MYIHCIRQTSFLPTPPQSTEKDYKNYHHQVNTQDTTTSTLNNNWGSRVLNKILKSNICVNVNTVQSPTRITAANINNDAIETRTTLTPSAALYDNEYQSITQSPTPPQMLSGANRYKKKFVLNTGSTSKVYLAYDVCLQRDVALKCILKTAQNKSSIENEIELLTQLNHTNIIKMIDIFETTHFAVLVQEYVDAGDLVDHVPSYIGFDEKRALHVFSQVVNAVKHLHDLNIVHRDIKPDNCAMMKDGKIILIDFGSALKPTHFNSFKVNSYNDQNQNHQNYTDIKQKHLFQSQNRNYENLSQQHTNHNNYENNYLSGLHYDKSTMLLNVPHAGTIQYMSPELILNFSKSAKRNNSNDVNNTSISNSNNIPALSFHTLKAQDIWSLGVLLFTLLTGEFPWKIATLQDRTFSNFIQKTKNTNNKNQNPDISHRWNNINGSILNLLTKLLDVNMDRRYNIHQTVKHLNSILEMYDVNV